MAQYIYDKFINPNAAPKGAHHIGVYNREGKKVGNIPLGSLDKTQVVEPLYKFGLLSDIHVDTTDYSYSQYLNAYPYSDEGEGDFRRALKWLTEKENVDMVCACGDLSQNGTTAEFQMPQRVISDLLPTSKGVPFYTCTGNHDVKTAGGNGFGNYFLRSFEQSWNGMTGFERSSAFNESYCFSKQVGQKTDHFIFFSMYSYSLGSSASPYLDADINWLEGKLEQWKNDRCFIFTHLFFPDYAGNLGRVNGTGGIYPTGNWLGGSQLVRLSSFLSKYSNAIWFSGHSHWKWDLQKFQKNITLAQYGVNGAWTVHVPSLALPIDSDYTNLGSETSSNRVEKPLESQGGIVEVYEDSIVIKGIDFNVNTSENGANTQGFSGDTYVRYLPIAIYNINTQEKYVAEEGETITEGVLIGPDNIKISTSDGRADNCSQIVLCAENDKGEMVTSVEFDNASQSCIFTSPELQPTDIAFRISYENVNVKLKKVSDGTITEVPVSDIDNYLGWLKDYTSSGGTNGSVYSLEKVFNYNYSLSTQYSGFTYGDVSTNTSLYYGIQLNSSSKLSNSGATCWIDNYLTPAERSSLDKTTTSDYHIIIEFTNLRISSIRNNGSTPSVSMEAYTYSELSAMEVGDSVELVMASPNKNDGYVLGYNGSSTISTGNGFSTKQAMETAVASVVDNDNYHMVLSKKQDIREEQTTTNVARTFSVSGTFNNVTMNKITDVNINGYDAYGVSGTSLTTTTRTANTTITFDGTELPRGIYAKLYVSNTGATATATISNGGTGTITKSTNQTFTSTSNYASISMTSNTLTISTTVRRSQYGQRATWIILIPTGVTEAVTTTTQVPDGNPYYTLETKTGSKSPNGTNSTITWGTPPIKFTLENPTSLSSEEELSSGVSVPNDSLIRLKNASNYYLNSNGNASTIRFSDGLGEWSAWYLYKTNSASASDYLQVANFETNTEKGSLSVAEHVRDLGNGYVAVTLSATSNGFWVSPSNMVANVQPTLVVDDLKVYSGAMVTSGTEISLPQYVGFYNGASPYSGATRYQIANGFKPSYTESGGNGRLQFQTSSSYTGGTITIVMKVRFTY